MPRRGSLLMKTETIMPTQKGSLLPFAAYLQAGESWTPLLIINGEQPEVNLTEPQKIMIVYLPNGTDVEVENNTLDFFSIIVGLLSGTRVLSNVPVAPVKWSGVPDGGNRTATVSSPLEECKILYSCMYYVVQRQAASLFLDPLTKYFKDCISAVYKHALACPLEISTVTTAWHSPCFSSTQGLTASDWKAFGVDRQLQNFLPGGPEPNGIFWTGIQMVYGDQSQTPGVVDNVWWPRKNQSFSVAVGRQMLGVDDLVCSLAVPCSPAVDCSQIGSHLALGLGATVWPCDWCLYTVAAMKNINQQLSNQYVAIKGSAIEATLRTFKIQDFFPQPNQHFGLFNALSGLAGILTFLGGFAPGLVGPALGQASNAVSSIGNFLGRSIGSPPGAQVPQETFADAVAIIYADFIKGLETVTEMLFNGSLVDGKFGIIDMMKDGAWVNVDSLQRVSDIEDQLAIEIISRSINALWKTPTSNKIFVIFQDLADDPNTMANCQADISGPPDLKYCGDGGVYYTYNYIEDGSHEGHLGWPWGANKLEEQVRIKPAWITEASARTYRLAKQTPGLDPFSFSDINGTAAFLSSQYNSPTPINLQNLAGRYPGSWTVPVCDTGTWGESWNWNYINNSFTNENSVFPCICGKDGSDSEPFVRGAGLTNFDTFYRFCKNWLHSEYFVWPEGITSVSYGFGDPIKKPGT